MLLRRYFFLALALLGAAAACRSAQAQNLTGGSGGTGGTGGAGGLTGDDFAIYIQDQSGASLTEFQIGRYFNRAKCQCETPIRVFVTLKQTSWAKATGITQGFVRTMVGTSCDQQLLRESQCTDIGSSQTLLVDVIRNRGIRLDSDARTFSTNRLGAEIDPDQPLEPCTNQRKFQQTVYVLVDANQDSTYESWATRAVQVDTEPPPSLDDIRIEPGNEALTVSWTGLDAATHDILNYQVLCARAGSMHVFEENTFEPGYDSASSVCPTAGNSGTLERLDPLFLCSGDLAPSTTSFRIKILQNDIFYGVAVVPIDRTRNAGLPVVKFGKPEASINFYGYYREGDGDEPGTAMGGFCSVAPATPGSAAGTIGLALAGLAMLAARGRRRR